MRNSFVSSPQLSFARCSSTTSFEAASYLVSVDHDGTSGGSSATTPNSALGSDAVRNFAAFNFPLSSDKNIYKIYMIYKNIYIYNI
jgi:hypothetical protein